MKLRVSQDLCAGQGCCAAAAPLIFELDNEGFNVARGKEIEVDPDREEEARRGALSCPETAIEVLPE